MTQDRITATVRSEGTGRDADGWQHNAYRVTLRYQGRTMTVPFKTGTGWDHPPTAADVLECLLSDASGSDGYTFENWADEYGYETDSRAEWAKHEKTYKAVVRQTNSLRRLLGDDFDRFVYPDGNEWPNDVDHEHVAAAVTADA